MGTTNDETMDTGRSDEAKKTRFEEAQDRADTMLASLIESIDTEDGEGSEQEITIILSGRVVRGTLISWGAYTRAHGVEPSDATQGSKRDKNLPRYFHLKDYIIESVGNMTFTGAIFRGRLSSVDGYTPGKGKMA